MTFFDGSGPVFWLCALGVVFLVAAAGGIWLVTKTLSDGELSAEHDYLDALKELP